MTLMSHAAISASLTGCPSRGVSAPADDAPKASVARTAPKTTQAALSIHMLDLPAALDPPAGDAVEVLIGESEDRWRLLGLAAQRHELGAGRLHVAAFVEGAALQHGRLAIPAPGHAKAG